MTSPEDSSIPSRREFVQRIVGAGAAVASASLVAGCASLSAASAPAPSAGGQHAWDMSWIDKLGTFRTAYDSPEVMGGAALAYAEAAVAGYKATGGRDGDFTPVLILRHRASIMVLNDDMWRRLTLGEEYKIDDLRTSTPATRNPFVGEPSSGGGTQLDALIRRGAVALACNYALTGVANRLKTREPARGFTTESALEEVHRSVLPGCYVMPNGIFAVSAAQDAGCHYMRVLV